MDYPKTRKEAKKLGISHYYTGIPCKYGHIDLRNIRAECLICKKIEWKKSNKIRLQNPKSKASKEAGSRYYEKNKELVKARANARPKEEISQYKKTYKINNPEYYKALVSVRRRKHRKATPKWITASQKLAMRELYLQAQNLTKLTGERYVVDHIVPLINEAICGLHVPWNLRVITQKENLNKSNKLLASN